MEQPGNVNFSILTWNIWNDTEHDLALRSKMIVSKIKNLSPDVILFQEMTTQMLSYLSTLFVCYPFRSKFPPSEPYFTTIFSKHPLHNIHRLPFPKSTMYRDLLHGTVSVDGYRIFICTSHLESLGSGSFAREKQLTQALHALYKNQEDSSSVNFSVFGGDTNLKPLSDGDVEHVVAEEYWRDAWHLVKDKSEKSEQDQDGATRGKSRIDRFFVASKIDGFEFVDCVVIGKEKEYSFALKKDIEASDHYGVCLTVKLKTRQSKNMIDLPEELPAVTFKRPKNWMKYI